jgi:hypothetical protein
MTGSIVSLGLIITYILLGLSVVLMILMPVFNAIGNPRTLLQGLYGLIFIGIVFGISVVFSNADQGAFFSRFGYGPVMSKIIGAGLISMYILLVLSVLTMLITEVLNIFR